jgi:hypothetical protein
MGIGLLFWILMLFWLVFGLYSSWGRRRRAASGSLGNSLLLFILLLVLGWAQFGAPIH